MNLAGKEYNKKNKTYTKTKIKEEKPEWFDKSIEAKRPDNDTLKEMKELLNEFK